MQITEEAQFFGPLFAVKKLEKMGWATFWPFLSLTHLAIHTALILNAFWNHFDHFCRCAGPYLRSQGKLTKAALYCVICVICYVCLWAATRSLFSRHRINGPIQLIENVPSAD
jgi:hypothetical protein